MTQKEEGTRYLSFCGAWGESRIKADPEGDLIEYSEYQKLEAENAKLRALVEWGASTNRLDECDCIAVTGGHRCFSCACKEALK